MEPARGTTHAIEVDPSRGVVVKRYRSRERGEPEREWAALTLLADCAPGLAARPIRAELLADPAVIEMSWLPGLPLSAVSLQSVQVEALARALTRLWEQVPAAPTKTAVPNQLGFASQVRSMSGNAPDADPLVRRANQAGATWLASWRVERLPPAELVFGHGDPNLSNFLWDGLQIRIVDFEDSGPSERAFELAILVEHISAWAESGLDAAQFLALFELTQAELARLLQFRRLAALFWLLTLWRRPAQTHVLRQQATRLLTLLS